MFSSTDVAIAAWSSLPPDNPMPLLERRRVIGEKAMISRVALQKGCFVASHAHENEQITCMIEGALKFGLGRPNTPEYREVVARAGDVVHLPPNLPHSAEALEDTLVLDVFAPPSATTGIDAKEHARGH